MVVGLPFNYCARAINLLGEGEAYHLVGERHLGKAELFVGTAVDGWRETIGASDDEDETAGGLLFLFQPTGKLNATVFFAVFIEKYNSVSGLQLFEDEFTLCLLLLFLCQVLRIFQFGNGENLKGHIVADTLYIVVDAGYEVLIDRFTNLNEYCLHDC